MALGEKLRDARLKRKLTTSQVAAATRMKVQIVEDLENEDFTRIAAPIYGKGFIKMYAQHVGLDPRPLVAEYMAGIGGGRTRAPSTVITPEQPPTAAITPEQPPADEPPSRPEPVDEVAEEESEEPDLFASIDEVEEERVEPPETGAEKKRRPAVGPSSARMLRRAADTAGEMLERIGALLGQACGALAGKIKRPQIRIADWPLRSASLTVALLIVLVFIASCISRCVRRPRPSAEEHPDRELRLSTQPPDAYIE